MYIISFKEYRGETTTYLTESELTADALVLEILERVVIDELKELRKQKGVIIQPKIDRVSEIRQLIKIGNAGLAANLWGDYAGLDIGLEKAEIENPKDKYIKLAEKYNLIAKAERLVDE